MRALGCHRSQAPSEPGRRYPAFDADVPRIENQGGAVLAHAKIVSVVWTADPNHAVYERLVDALGSSNFWRSAVEEYGIGAASSGGHVEIATPPPASIERGKQKDVDALVADGVAGAPGNGWPVPDDRTMYMVFLPQAKAFLEDGRDACPGGFGYHTEINVGASPHVVYGVVASACPFAPVGVQTGTAGAVHEIAEAVTDPHTKSDLAWSGFDADHLAWELFQAWQDENGDACEGFPDSIVFDHEIGVTVQRLWSNASARAGHDPRVPAPDDPYFNVSAIGQEPISVTGGDGVAHETKGFRIGVGSERTFQVGFHSDAPIGDGFGVHVFETDLPTLGPAARPHVDLSLDTTDGTDGTTTSLTVKVLTPPSAGNEILVTFVSKRLTAPTLHFYPVVIGVY